MPDSTTPADPIPAAPLPPSKDTGVPPGAHHKNVIIRPYPKIVFFYPTFIVATACWIISMFLDVESAKWGTLGAVFMCTLIMNLLVFSFDFSRIKSITLFILSITIVLAVLWADTKWEVTGALGNIFRGIDIRMNTQFYGFMSAALFFCLILVLINTRFNYYEVNHREILHHHGYLGDVTRMPTQGLLLNKEIYDLMEFILLRSGRLIFLPATSREAVVIDNVINVNVVEDRIKDLLSVVAVRLNH